MKLKTVKFERQETEVDLELPVYLYKQSELCEDEYVKVEHNKRTTVYNTLTEGYGIRVDKCDGTIRDYELNSIGKKEWFDEAFSEMIEKLTK